MSTNTDSDRLWTPAELAKNFGVSKAQVFRWAYENGLPYVRLSERVVRFDPAAVREWALARQENGPQRATGGEQ